MQGRETAVAVQPRSPDTPFADQWQALESVSLVSAETLQTLIERVEDGHLAVLMGDDTGVLHAPPGFGKTVTAAAVIAKRACSTLVIVHTTALLRKWRARLDDFLSAEVGEIRTLGGGRKSQLTGRLDIADVRSLAKLDDNALANVLDHYGQIIVDECHHAGAATC